MAMTIIDLNFYGLLMLLLLPSSLDAEKICENELKKIRQCRNNDNIEFFSLELAAILFHFVSLSCFSIKELI